MGRPPLHTESQLIALANSLKARYGIVTVMSLRAAAGGGSPNRLQRILASMPHLQQPSDMQPDLSRPDALRSEPERAVPAALAPASPVLTPDARELSARIESLERACAETKALIREERRRAAEEMESIGRLIERQNKLIEGVSIMLEHALHSAARDAQTMREELGSGSRSKSGKHRMQAVASTP